jgi:hypothetical protein
MVQAINLPERAGQSGEWSIGTARGVHLQSLQPVLAAADLFNAEIAKGRKVATDQSLREAYGVLLRELCVPLRSLR